MMSEGKPGEKFSYRIDRGRKFENWERAFWKDGINALAEFETPTQWEGKRGRMDIRLVDVQEGHTIVVELKSTNWDSIKSYRVRPNALRHARQIWRFIEAELQCQPVLPAIVYSRCPKSLERKAMVEALLNDRLIQVVWREEYSE